MKVSDLKAQIKSSSILVLEFYRLLSEKNGTLNEGTKGSVVRNLMLRPLIVYQPISTL